MADRRPLGLGLSGGSDARHHVGARLADPLQSRGDGPVLGLRHPVAQRSRQLPEGRLRVGGDAERNRIAATDLPGIVVDLDDAQPARERHTLGVQEPGEHVGAGDQEHVALLERLSHGSRRGKKTATPEGVIARDVRAPVHGLAVHASTHQLGQRRQLGHGA